MKIAEPIIIGNVSNGLLRIIPIIGGTFSGNDMQGEILPGGADWNTEIRENLAHVFASYAIQTDDGIVILIENEGYIDSHVGKSTYLTFPKLKVPDDSRLAWLQREPLIGTLTLLPESECAVEIAFFRMDCHS